MISRPEHLAFLRDDAWTDLHRDPPRDPFSAFVLAGRILRCVGPLDGARTDAQALRDRMLRGSVLDDVDALAGDITEVAGEILDDLAGDSFVPSRLDALALYHHREDLESLREGVTRVIALLTTWPDAPFDHAIEIRGELDAACAHLEERYFSRDDIARRCVAALAGPEVDPAEPSLAEGLRSAARRHGGAWWLDPFAPPRQFVPRPLDAARMAGPPTPGEVLARMGFEGRFQVEVFADASGEWIAELSSGAELTEPATLSWIDLDRTPPTTRSAAFRLDHGQWICAVDGSIARTDVAAIELGGRLYALTERGEP